MRSLRQFWTPRRIGEDRVTLARLGPLRLWLARAEKEWGFAREQGDLSHILDIAQVPEDVIPDRLEWTTILFREAPREFRLQAVVPDRPLVVKPVHPVTFPAGECGVFYVFLPVFLELVFITREREHVVATIPANPLSDTWFGTAKEGEFCYSLPFPASRDLASAEIYPHHIVCPVEIENRSAENLVFAKLCLRPRHLSLYCGQRFLWSSRVEVSNEHRSKRSILRYPRGAPAQESGLILLNSPQEKPEKNLQLFSFGNAFRDDIQFAR
ncbi:MAG: hypothetical protein GVY10_08010 [Verrucomicrobia bacterium]|jgi:hypothetical protein|nr:hypothetical protein [Verrucomicrobiota bacterium]